MQTVISISLSSIKIQKHFVLFEHQNGGNSAAKAAIARPTSVALGLNPHSISQGLQSVTPNLNTKSHILFIIPLIYYA